MNSIILFTSLFIFAISIQFDSPANNIYFKNLAPTPSKIVSKGTEEFYPNNFKIQFYQKSTKDYNNFLQDQNFIQFDNQELLSPYVEMFNKYIDTRFTKKDISFQNNSKGPIQNSYIHVKLENIDQPKDLKDVTKIDESYEIYIHGASQKNLIELYCKGYVSFLRALETLFQIYEEKQKFSHLPIQIQDKPSMKYRGIMIDTARHYFDINHIQNHIDGMRMNKLNVLHLHLTDSESFPVEIPLVPELSKYGAFSQDQVYTLADILRLQHYAQVNGVLLVPEFDTPAHTRSWSLSPKYSHLQSCPDYPPSEWANYCEEPPCGNIDPVSPDTWYIISQVLNYTQVTFESDLIHMGGDEVKYLCWDQKPSIKKFMNENNIPDYNALEAWFRKKQSSLISQNKRAMYWMHGNSLNLESRPQDILQFWDSEENYHLLHEVSQDIVLSPYNYLYLACGIGNSLGGHSWCAPFKTWLHIYEFEPRKANIGDRLLGAELPLFTELADQGNIDSLMWPYATSFAIRMWNLDDNLSHQQLAQKIVNNKNLLVKYTGLKPAPISSEYCENNTHKCFFNNQ